MSEIKPEEKQASVAYFIHEGQMARMERIIRRLIVLLIVAIVLFIANNVVWMLYAERQVSEARTYVGANGGVHQLADP